jgi:hypothetical protein
VELLPVILEPEDALKAGATLLNPEIAGQKEPNLFKDQTNIGDVERASRRPTSHKFCACETDGATAEGGCTAVRWREDVDIGLTPRLI